MLTGQGPSKHHEVWYFAQTKLGALRMDNYKYQFIDQPEGWIGPVVHPNMRKPSSRPIQAHEPVGQRLQRGFGRLLECLLR
jgi:hypothetical protein